MNIILLLLCFILLVLLSMNAYVHYLVANSEYYEPQQKYMQYALIWFLPVIGVLLCYLTVQTTLGPGTGKYSKDRLLDEGEHMDFQSSNKDYFDGN